MVGGREGSRENSAIGHRVMWCVLGKEKISRIEFLNVLRVSKDSS